MASPEVLSRLELRAVQAEQMIDVLTKQIAQLQAVVVDTHKEKLRKENQDLRLEVNRLKTHLVNLEKSQGIIQYQDFNKKTTSFSPASDPQVQPAKGKDDKKSEKKEKKKSGEKKPEDEGPIDVSRLDFRVGRIVSVQKHPDADTLYVEQVDVGEEKTRTVLSGIVKFFSVEEMQNRMVVLLCNLKPAKMRGITSEAMVMLAHTPEKMEFLAPPKGSQPGDLIEFEGYPRNPDAVLNPKKKIFETCAPDLKIDTNRVAVYKGVPFTIPGKGVVVSETLINVQVK